MKKISLFSLLFVALASYAAIPENYYASIDGKSSNSILTTLHSIINNHTVIGYSSLEPYYAQTDLDAEGHILDMYSTCVFTMANANPQQKKVCDGWNKEHSVPQSWFNEASPMKSDLFHVVPTDARVNNFRGNMPYGETSSRAYVDNDKSALGYIGSSVTANVGKVFEPVDEYKGDFARIYFYMLTRYLDRNLAQSEGAKVFDYSGSTLSFTDYAIALFLKWHRQDPVSQKEIDRNNAVYGIQNNRNPFVDYPYLVEYIWGNEKSTTLNMATQVISSEDPNFVPNVSDGSWASINPTLRSTAQAISFPAILAGNHSDLVFTITGANLTQGISLVLSGANADLFTLSQSSVSAENANKANSITISYAPLAVGNFSATLTVSSEGAESLVIPVSGSCASECSITWMVDGQEYTAGNPTTKLALGSAPEVLPSAPQSCSEESPQFVGWSASLIDSITDDVPADLFTDADDAPSVGQDVVYYAVFANLVEVPGTAAETDSIDFTKRCSNAEEMKNLTVGSTTLTFTKKDGSTQPKYYTDGAAVRCYWGSTLTIAAKNMSKIVFVFGSKDKTNSFTANVGTYSSDTNTWTGKADEVTFTVGGTSGNRAISAIYVTSQESTTVYDYSRYITTCSPVTAIEYTSRPTTTPSAVKMLRDGQLIIECEGVIYNAQGCILAK